jgi:hypothetical protein
MPNYLNSKIYRLVCNKTGRTYIGSTTISLASRLSHHKKVFNTNKSCSSRAVLEYGDYSIILIEDFPCERKEQLFKRERFYIDSIDCCNKQLPTRTKAEWYNDNKYRLIKNQIVWNNNNKDKLKKYKETFKNKSKGIFVDLTNIDIDEDEAKINIEDIYDCDELLDKEVLIEVLEKKISDNINE